MLMDKLREGAQGRVAKIIFWLIILSFALAGVGSYLNSPVDTNPAEVNGEPITLPLKEFDLLEILLRNAGRVLTRGQLIDRVWGADYVGDTKTLDVHVKRLRGKIDADPANRKYFDGLDNMLNAARVNRPAGRKPDRKSVV